MPLRARSSVRVGEASTRVGVKRCGGSTSPSRPLLAREAVDDVEQPAELEVGQRALVRQRAGELQPAVIDAGETADQPDAAVAERIEIQSRAAPASR